MHKMRTRPGPQHHVRTPEVLRHLVVLEHGAIGDVAGYPWLAVADNLLARSRPHAVAADECASFSALARLQHERDAVLLLLVALYRAIGFERDQIAGLTSFEDSRVDIGAMSHRIGIMEAFEETRVLKRDAGDQLARERAAHLHGGRTVGVGEHDVLEPELVKGTKNIGAE